MSIEILKPRLPNLSSLWTDHPNSLLATDNPASPAEAGHLDSRLKFPLRGTKQFKPAKRGTKNQGSHPDWIVQIFFSWTNTQKRCNFVDKLLLSGIVFN